MQRINQCAAPFAVVQQVVLQIRVARHHPDVAQHLVEHLRGAAGAAFRTQGVDDVPCFVSQQSQDDFAVGKRGVVIGDFT